MFNARFFARLGLVAGLSVGCVSETSTPDDEPFPSTSEALVRGSDYVGTYALGGLQERGELLPVLNDDPGDAALLLRGENLVIQSDRTWRLLGTLQAKGSSDAPQTYESTGTWKVGLLNRALVLSRSAEAVGGVPTRKGARVGSFPTTTLTLKQGMLRLRNDEGSVPVIGSSLASPFQEPTLCTGGCVKKSAGTPR